MRAEWIARARRSSCNDPRADLDPAMIRPGQSGQPLPVHDPFVASICADAADRAARQLQYSPPETCLRGFQYGQYPCTIYAALGKAGTRPQAAG